MEKLTKTKERVVEFGEVYTPYHIVIEMLNLIPESDWTDPKHITLEPTCGNGNFVVEIVKRKIASGHSIEHSINTTFGMDILKDNIEECRIRLLEICKLYRSKKSDLLYCMCLIVNNIFVVEDSIEYIRSGKFSEKKFYDKDPTGFAPKKRKLFFIKDEENPDVCSQVLTIKQQAEIKKTAAILLNRNLV